MKTLMTLCIVVEDDKVLLGMKKRGFGAGRWNGFGGKLNPGESIEDAARRELQEESGIEARTLDHVGILEFTFQDNSKILEVHIFRITDFIGEPVETEEMRPQWFNFSDIPYAQMWSDDKLWLPLVLEGKHFSGSFLFDTPATSEYASLIINHKLTIAE